MDQHAGSGSSAGTPPGSTGSGGDDVLGMIQSVEAQLAALRRRHAETESAHREASERQRTVAQREEDLGRRGASLEERAAELESRAAELDERASTLELEREALEERAAALEAEREALEERSATIEATEESMRAELEALERMGAQGDRERRERDDAIQQRERALREGMGELERRLAAASEAQEGSGEGVEALRREMEEAILERDARIEELAAALESARESGAQGLGDDERRELESAIAEREERLEALERELESAREAMRGDEGLEAMRTACEEALAARDRAIEALRRAGGDGGARQEFAATEHQERRRERLAALRRGLRERGAKLARAGEQLRAKFQQADQVLAQRQQIVAARQSLVEAQRRVETAAARAAKTRASALVFYIVTTFAVLAGLSWGITTQAVPASYAASALVAVDDRGTSADASQLAAWQQFHEGMLLDPQFLQTVAERMQRRGIATLSSAADLLTRLRSDMYVESPAPGQIRVELRGKGAARTERELETYVTALVSHATAAKQRRSDGLGTVVRELRGVGPGPIEDRRLVVAAGILGGGVSVCGLIGWLFWRKLRESKVRFENEAFEDVMDVGS